MCVERLDVPLDNLLGLCHVAVTPEVGFKCRYSQPACPGASRYAGSVRPSLISSGGIGTEPKWTVEEPQPSGHTRRAGSDASSLRRRCRCLRCGPGGRVTPTQTARSLKTDPI
jgi:hypothetical protein